MKGRNCNKNGYPISGHLYKLVKRLSLDRMPNKGTLEVGTTNNHDWWIQILAERNIAGCPDDFPKHFKRVCFCKKYLCKNRL